ncbi:MarR family transcriptional regulator [Pelomicrobium methylotrophicum]|uniref:MarR family transcriptional regulator n=1 Tax=Pelomicrobium methylotrophicum TaxID=2602750 RepID=A0A5C7EVD5_9PROT|nr:MarR family transcriptional regulator [Pelomicrobium methylotrophicum]
MPSRRPSRKKPGVASPASRSRQPVRRERPSAPRGRRSSHDRRVQEVLRKFRIVFKSSVQHSRWVESHCGVNAPQLWALSELARQPGLRVADLAHLMSLHASTTSNLLDGLEQRGLIERVRDQTDQRVVRLIVTEAGLQFLKNAPAPAMSLLPDALYKLPDKVLEELNRAMTQLVAKLVVKDEQAGYEPINVP